MKNAVDTFYMNIDTQERVRVVWRVSVTLPTYTDGYVVVEATTEAEAIELALSKHFDEVKWDSWGDEGAVDVIDGECENPPVYCLLMNACRYTGANLDALCEPEKQSTAKEEQGQQKANAGGEPCK